MIFTTCLSFAVVAMIECATTSSLLLNSLREHRTIVFQPTFSSAKEINIDGEMKWNLTCAFLSNFPRIDLFWLHNGTLIQSFISKTLVEDDNTKKSFLAVSIVSTLQMDHVHFDINGFYQCIAVYQEIHVQQTFTVHLHTNDISSTPIDFSRDASIIVYTAQALFEPRKSIDLLCRIGGSRKETCQIQWLDPNDQPVDVHSENTDLVIANATFESQMGLYTCRICCTGQCQKFTSFVYPTDEDQ